MSQPAIEMLFERLEASLRERNKTLPTATVYIYGAGNVGRQLFGVLKERGVSVVAFLDRNAKPGTSHQGAPILLPDDSAISPAHRKEAQVYIGIFNRDTEIPPIVQFLQGLGYEKISTFLEIHDLLAGDLGDHFWLTAREFYAGKREEIFAGHDLLSDETSRKLYADVLRFRFTMDYQALPMATMDDQYFPAGLPSWPNPLRFVDCGAFDGDTLRQLVERQFQIEAIAAFEPDPANFQKVTRLVASNTAKGNATVSVFPCGVSSTTRQLRFSSGMGSSSHASENGDIVIQCVALDEALAGFRPNVIKMDIEGAEYDALLGAERIVRESRPGLAISVYHRADHLWTIPLLAKSWLQGGNHYLRAHAHNAFELIYYWIP